MANEEDIAVAREVYNKICSSLDKMKLAYDKNDADFSVRCVVKGKDLPMPALIYADTENELIVFQSELQTVFPQERIINAAVAINAVNFNVIDGSFGLDVHKGTVNFRLTCSYIEREITDDLLAYVIVCSFNTVDAVNDKLQGLLNGELELEDFVKNFGC